MGKSFRRTAAAMRSREGVTAIEYAMIAAFVSIGIAAALTTLGGSLKTIFTNVSSAL